MNKQSLIVNSACMKLFECACVTDFFFLQSKQLADRNLKRLCDLKEGIQRRLHGCAFDHRQMASGNCRKTAEHFLREAAGFPELFDSTSQSLIIKIHN